MDKDLMLYTLHRFAVYAAGRGIPFNQSALETALSGSGIDNFGDLVDLDEPARNDLGRTVLENLKLEVPLPADSMYSSLVKLRQSAR